MPVFNLALDGEHFYGFPAHGIPGFKLGRYDHFGSGGDPDTIDREPTLADEAPLRAFAERYFPDGAGPTVALKTCLFEPSPDEHFLIDRHPDAPAAVVGAGFSGHGYKFCSVVGEILADLAIDGSTRARHRAVPARPLLSTYPSSELRARERARNPRGRTVRAGGLEPPRTLRPNGT